METRTEAWSIPVKARGDAVWIPPRGAAARCSGSAGHPSKRCASRQWAEESALLAAVRAGNQSAATALVRRFGGRMMAAAVRLLRDAALAEDCVQEAFVSAFRNLERFEGRSSLGTWLHRITVNACLVKMRARKRAPESPLEGMPSGWEAAGNGFGLGWQVPVSAEDLVAEGQLRDLVRARIGELPDDYRIVLTLRDIEELNTREVAAVLRISEGAVKVRLHRARAALRRRLESAPLDTRDWVVCPN